MKTWKEKIVAVLTGQNSRGKPLWYSHKKIMQLVSDAEGYDISVKYRSLSNYLLELVKSGHLERTIKPAHLSDKVQPNKEYLYRRTAKPYNREYMSLQSSKNNLTDAHIRGQEAFELWRKHRTLPKWFRRMMMD